ncbi:MAG: hypothetical protein H6507_00790 [Calditrichaeota bacterium]|nr:hypothetical protein [Calditrichota bacterium]
MKKNWFRTVLGFTALVLTFQVSTMFAADEAHDKPGAKDPVPALQLVAPNGGEVLLVGKMENVKWECVTMPTTGGYDLYLSQDGGKSFVQIASDLSDGGCVYEWKVDGLNSSQCVMRVMVPLGGDKYIYDDSDAMFSISTGQEETATLDKRKLNGDKPTQSMPADTKPAIEPTINPQLRVNAPNGGEAYEAGSTVKVSWKCEPTAAFYNVSVSYDGGKSYTLVGTELKTGECSYDWKSGMKASDNCLVRVEAKTTMGVMIDDISDSAFKITPSKKLNSGKASAEE